MDGKKGLNQIDFLIQKDITWGNTVCLLDDLPENCSFLEYARKIADYNNHKKGIIDSDFFSWALKNDVPYEAIRWFVEDFSGQNDVETKSLIKAFYKKYHIYLDESCNPIKFRIKNDIGETNTSWFDDFTLAGVVIDENCDFDVDLLFSSLDLQKNIIDAKLKHIADFKGNDANRFLNILKSSKVKILLDTLRDAEGVFIHWSTQSLWYYSLIDLVDSTLEIPFIAEPVKNYLFSHAIEDPYFFTILAEHNYPNIYNDDVRDFCSDLINWIEGITTKNPEEDFCLECLRQGIKSSRRFNNIGLLMDNNDRVLIEDFVANYALRLAQFPNSVLAYDEYSAAQVNIGKYEKVYCTDKVPIYSFECSTNNRMMQLADFIAGLTSAFMAYINTHDRNQIDIDLNGLSDIQNYNLRAFLSVRLKSSRHNIYFDNMSSNYSQMDRIRYLMTQVHIE